MAELFREVYDLLKLTCEDTSSPPVYSTEERDDEGKEFVVIGDMELEVKRETARSLQPDINLKLREVTTASIIEEEILPHLWAVECNVAPSRAYLRDAERR